MEYRELTHSEAFKLWQQFGEEIGNEELRQCYGSYWPRQPVQGERVWEVFDFQRVGWLSLRPDPVDPVIWFVVGILPQYQRAGASKEIFRWAARKAFEEWPKAEAMIFAVNKKNEQYLKVQEKTINKVKMGELLFPSGSYVLFGVENRNKV